MSSTSAFPLLPRLHLSPTRFFPPPCCCHHPSLATPPSLLLSVSKLPDHHHLQQHSLLLVNEEEDEEDEVEGGDRQHQKTRNKNRQSKILAIRARLSHLCKEGRLDIARRLFFDSIPLAAAAKSSPPPPTTLLWNTLLIGYVCNSLPDEALHLYALMNSSSFHHHGLPPRSDSYTYSSALKACADARRLRLGQSIHAHIIRHSPVLPPRNWVLNNSLLNMYASTLEPTASTAGVDVVRLMFDRMPKRNVVAWNTLIDWYVRAHRPANALAQFKLMVKVGIRPTPVSFINVFPAAVACAEEGHRWSRSLHGKLVKCGSEYVNNQFVISSAIFMYCELSDLQSARRVFDQAEDKNTQVWNTLLGGYVQNGCFVEALCLLVQILESQTVDADSVTFLSSLMAVSQLQDVSLGQQIHAYLVKENSSSLPLILCNALIVMYSRCGYVQTAFEIFHQMQDRDIISWNTMISAFVQNDLNLEGLLLVHEMQKDLFALDAVTVMALLSAASNLGSLRIGKEAHGYLIRHGIQSDGMESYLIDMYAKSGSVETARQLFDDERYDERDQVTWNTMISGYTQSGQTEEAMALFREMLEENQLPNSVTLASVIPACSPVGGFQAGKQIHGFAIRHYLDSNVFVSTALIDIYSKCGQISYAERVFDGMAEKNTVTYTTMLSGLGQHGLGERALSLFYSMLELGTKPDAITFVAVISACSYSGLVDEGLAVYDSMEELGVVATPEHHCCVVDLLGRAGRVEEAYEFVRGLGDEGCLVGIWGSLLAACRVHGKTELGELVYAKLFDIGKQRGLAGYLVLLSNVYAADKNWDNVDRLRREMRDMGLRKEPGSSWVEVGDSSHKFMSRDQKHPEIDQIRRVLQQLSLEMKATGSKALEPCLVDGLFDHFCGS